MGNCGRRCFAVLSRSSVLVFAIRRSPWASNMYDVEEYDEKKKVIRGPIIYRSGYLGSP